MLFCFLCVVKKEGRLYKLKWYHNWFVIILLFLGGFLTYGLTSIIGGVLLALRIIANKEEEIQKLSRDFDALQARNVDKQEQNKLLDEKILNAEYIFKEKEKAYIADVRKEFKEEGQKIIAKANEEAKTLNAEVYKYIEEKHELEALTEKLRKQTKTQENRITKLKTEYLGINQLTQHFPEAIDMNILETEVSKYVGSLDEAELTKELLTLDCHYLNSKELRKQMNQVKKEVNKLLDSYVDRYTTKSNRTIYQLLVIGLQAELQNVIYSLTYEKLEEAQNNIKEMIRRYLAICADGNAQVLPTITRFLTSLEPLYLQAIEIEYHFYHKREQEREEQRLIREQMREEAAERKALAAQQKKIEQEEQKYNVELKRNQELLATEADDEKVAALKARILELEQLQNKVAEEKEEILKRANGKAGYVYVISNLGSFGEHKFKIGMTRRMEPMDRIDELSNASVPFRFDVHAMIFSDDAVSLEKQLHEELNDKRVNKINMRKEFFETTITELEELVTSLDPTVEFRPTLAAQEYRQTVELTKELQTA